MACSKDTVPVAGLEYLQRLSAVHIKQKVTGFTGNKYTVTTAEGELLFSMMEDSSTFSVLLNGTRRSFNIDGVDVNQKTVFSLRRPYEFLSDKVEVSMGGQLVSVVRREHTLLSPVYSINDAGDRPVLRVKGKLTVRDFKLQTLDKQTIGSITKLYQGFAKEVFTNADAYDVSFPNNLDLQYKVSVIAACILIDYGFHER